LAKSGAVEVERMHTMSRKKIRYFGDTAGERRSIGGVRRIETAGFGGDGEQLAANALVKVPVGVDCDRSRRRIR
jgi:hypothetical protein